MRRIITVVFISVAALYFTIVLVASGQTAPDTTTVKPAQLILTTDNSQGILNREAQFVYGPYSCTRNGDPFSPNNTVYTDERPYSYKYRIVIPSDYPDEVLRIEIFDPDSINQAITETAVSYTNLAIGNGFSATPETLPCPNSTEQSQSHTCIIKTNEDSLVPTVPGVAPEAINPVWLVRVDENRNGTPAGNCGPILDPYNPAHNTPLLFTLSYDRQNNDGTIENVPLARYTGQIGDGSHDSGDHETDLRWVSPGGALSSDQSIFVPVDPNTPINPATGQPYTFELNIEQDLPDIVFDTVTGDRIVHLHITGLPPGASKNTFALWAGPNSSVDTTPGDVNSRNLHLLNNPGAHNAWGVKILANEALPIQTLSDQGLDMPLIYFGPEYAGETVYLSVFDLDTGSLPPINFYMDTLAYTPDDSADGYDETKTDWAVAHGYAGDPEGGCFDNPHNDECNDTWVTYAITLPSDLECEGPPFDSCMPFYGGQFMARIQGGSEDELKYDSFTWSIRASQEVPEWDNTQGCSAFPIAVDEDIRSVLPPDSGSSSENRWRNDFDYPNPIPDYESFIDHMPNEPLINAKEGYLYNISNGESAGGKGWLVWNQCIGATATALTESLTWPGNSKDYTPSGGQCIVNGEVMDRFPGFMEVGDNTDKSMHIGDWVAVNTGSVTSNSVIDALEEHVDLDRILRVVVYDPSFGTGVDGDTAYQMSRFALLRLIGFSMSQGGGESFILAEFIGWDDSCGQLAPVAIDSVTIQPDPDIVGNVVTVTAVSTPTNATQPISYTWEANGETIIHSNGLTNTASFTLPYASTQTITVTANNDGSNPVMDTIEVNIAPQPIPLTSVTIQPDPDIMGNVVTVTAVSTPTNATQPISYTWEADDETIVHSTGLTDTASFTLPYASTQTITVTANNGVGDPVTDTIEVTVEPLQLFLPIIISESGGQEASVPQKLDDWYNNIAYWNPLIRMNYWRS